MANAPKPSAIRDRFLAACDAGASVELVDGEIVEKASPTFEHGSAQAKAFGLLDPFNRGDGGPRGPGGWWLASEVEVVYAQNGDIYRHDLLGFRRDRHPERPHGMPLEITPDWACEVLSPSTARRDLVRKQRTLHAHRVPHFWILDPEHSVLTVLRWSEAGYVQALTAGVGDRVRAEPFEALELAVGELFGVEE